MCQAKSQRCHALDDLGWNLLNFDRPSNKYYCIGHMRSVKILRRRQNGHHLADIFFRLIYFYDNFGILIQISLKFVPYRTIDKKPALSQIKTWHQTGNKPLFEPMLAVLLMHIYATQPQWVNTLKLEKNGWHFADIFCWMKIIFWCKFHWSVFLMA